jgi:hypothetical protein
MAKSGDGSTTYVEDSEPMSEGDQDGWPAISKPAFDWDELDWIEQRLSPEHCAELERYRLEHDRNLHRHGHEPPDKLTFWRDELLFLPWGWGDDFPVSIARNNAVRLYHQLVETKLAKNLWNEWDAREARAAARIGRRNPAQPAAPHQPFGNEISEAAVVERAAVKVIADIDAGKRKNYAAAIRPELSRLEGLSENTKDKSKVQRVRGKVQRRVLELLAARKNEKAR